MSSDGPEVISHLLKLGHNCSLEAAEMDAGWVFDMLDALRDEFDLLGQRLVLLPVHQFLKGEIDHDDLSSPHRLSNFLLILFPLLLAALNEVPQLLFIHGRYNLVYLSLLCIPSLNVTLFLELRIIHISLQSCNLLFVLLVA